MITLILILFFLAVLVQSVFFISTHLNILYGARAGAYEPPFFLRFDYVKSFFKKTNLIGTVLDGGDIPIPYALVEVIAKGKLIYKTYTNSFGDFKLPKLKNDFYITCEKFGFRNKFEKQVGVKDMGKVIILRMDRENQIIKNPEVIRYLESSKKYWWIILAFGLISILVSIFANGPIVYITFVAILELMILYFLLTFRYKITIKNSEGSPIRNFAIEVFNEKNQKIANLATDKKGCAKIILSEGIYVFQLSDRKKSIKIDRRSIINFDFVI